MMAARKTCFVIMPYGKKPDSEGHEIDFDLVYDDVIREPVERAGLESIRCDEIEAAGSIHEDMFEHLATADVAVVDITNLNPNVFYELGARHALAKAVTVLIRKRGGATPFNIQDLRVIEYPGENGRMSESREKIQHFIENGLKSGDVDSPIHDVLERVRAARDETRRIEDLKSLVFRLRERRDTTVEIRTGDLRRWPGVDVWVNSENTNMQMARFYDRNLSAVIRYYGARKNENDEIVEDTIASELAEKMQGRESVSLGTVFDTSAGALAETHRVKKIFHVALVQGVPGEGYRAAREMIDTCVSRCLRRMDSGGGKTAELKSIAFPMMGTGAGGEDVREVAKLLIGTAVGYLEQNPGSVVEKVIFMAWNRRDLAACLAACGDLPSLETASVAS
jgi:O-acetyl-ADP-ribose deacetylase (regulator of RNase III)